MLVFEEGVQSSGQLLPSELPPIHNAGAIHGTSRKLVELDSSVVSKKRPGFRREDIEQFSDALEEALDENPKFLIFDFAHRLGASDTRNGFDGLPELIHACANLIATSSVVAVAWVRGPMAGADLEFALSCSMIAAEAPATFALSPYGAAYAFLARKIGVARAEQIMLERDVLDAAAMRDLLLVRHVESASGEDDAALEAFLGRSLRRHYALAHLYRALRLVMPVPFELVRAAHAA